MNARICCTRIGLELVSSLLITEFELRFKFMLVVTSLLYALLQLVQAVVTKQLCDQELEYNLNMVATYLVQCAINHKAHQFVL